MLIAEALRRRLGSVTGDLYLTALVGSVLSCTKAAMRDWAATTAEDAEDSGEQLEARILAALTMLRDGFSEPVASGAPSTARATHASPGQAV